MAVPPPRRQGRASIETTCENGHTFRVKKKYAGRQGKCPVCSVSVFVPNTDETRHEVGAPLETIDDGKPNDGNEELAPELGRFRIERLLGEGAFGCVYLAQDPQLDRKVALKVPKIGALGGEREAQRFLREAQAAAQLRHPNIVPIYDAGEIDNTYYIASAFVSPGRTLGDLISEEGQLEPRQAAKLIELLASALNYAHSLGIVHRDIKPDNILLDETGAPHIADFGLARREDDAAMRTQENVRMGTPAYMSPEQHAGKSREADGRSDMWALGVMLYKMLTGERPFRGNDVQLMYAVSEVEPERPGKIVSALPRDLETICLKCLAKDPDSRYATCQDLAEDLRRWRSDEPITARRVRAGERLWRWSKRNPAVASLATAVVVVTLVGLVGISSKWADAELQRRRAERFLQEAGEQRDEAQRQADLAENNLNDAEDQRSEAEKQRNVAEQRSESLAAAQGELSDKTAKLEEALDAAKRAKEEAENNAAAIGVEKGRADAEAARANAALRESQRNLYFANIALAQQNLENQDAGRADALLENCPDGLRGWEWSYLKRLCGSYSQTAQSEHTVTVVACSDAGEIFATGANDGSITLWDASVTELRTLTGHTARIVCLAISADSRTVVSGGNGKTIRVWDVSSGAVLHTFDELGAVPKNVAISPDGQFVMSTGAPATGGSTRVDDIGIWDIKTGVLVQRWPGHGYTGGAAAYDRDGRRIVSSGGDGVIRIRDAQSGAELRHWKAHDRWTNFVAFSNDGKLIVSAGDGEVKVWDVASARSIRTIKCSFKSAALSQDNQQLFIGEYGGHVRAWDINSGKQLRSIEGDGSIEAAAFSHGARHFIRCRKDFDDESKSVVTKWNRPFAKAGEHSKKLKAYTSAASVVAFSPDSNFLAVGLQNGLIEIWDAQTLTALNALNTTLPVANIAIGPKGKRLLSVEAIWGRDYKQIVKIWDLESSEVLYNETLPGSQLQSITFDPTGDRIASGGYRVSADNVKVEAIRVWDAQSGELLNTIGEKPGWISSVVFSPDGLHIKAVNGDRIWQVESGNLVEESATISSSWGGDRASDHDARKLTVERDEIRVCDVGTGRELLVIAQSGVRGAALSHNGRLLVACGVVRGEGFLRVWDAGDDERGAAAK